MSEIIIPALNISDIGLADYEEANLDYQHTHIVELTEPYKMNYYHWHRYYELLCVSEGSYKLINNKKTVESNRPAIFLHKPYSLHNMNTYSSIYRRKIAYISNDIINRYTLPSVDSELFTNANLIYVFPDPKTWQEIDFYLTMAVKHHADPISLALLFASIIRCMMQLAEDGEGEIVCCPFSYIQDVLNTIADNLPNIDTIESIARKFSVGKSKFQDDFREVTGLTYHQYLSKLRMNMAYRMILEGKSIIKTSMETGYSSESHFIQSFREFWNVTPGQLQQQKPKNHIDHDKTI